MGASSARSGEIRSPLALCPRQVSQVRGYWIARTSRAMTPTKLLMEACLVGLRQRLARSLVTEIEAALPSRAMIR
jgi:hypothetical protein